MSIKDHKRWIASCAALLFCGVVSAADVPSSWDGSPVGECSNKYKVPKPSEDYPVIVQTVKNTDAQKNNYVWIWDPSTEKNPTRQLIRITPKKVGCTVLFMPFSEFSDFKLSAHGNLPEKVTSTTATINDARGSYFFEHEYRLDKNTGYYQKNPACYKVKVGGAQREKVDCEKSVE